MSEWVYLAAGIPLLIAAVIIGISAVSVYLMPQATIHPLGDAESEKFHEQAAQTLDERFLLDEGFTWLGAYRMKSVLGSPVIAAWQQAGSPTYVCVYFIMGNPMTIDIVSIFQREPALGLTTGSSRDAHFIPHRPGNPMQSFNTRDIATLWRHHLDAEAMLAAELDVRAPASPDEPLEQLMMDAIRGQMAYVRTIPFWPAVMVWRYCVTRFTRHNRTLRALRGDARHH